MSYPCSQCGSFGPFSKNQKAKGPDRRCYDCVSGGGGGGGGGYECSTCRKRFRDQNSLTQHERTHRERSFPCPGCGQMYRGMTDTAAHFESGSCVACRGTDNARRAAYQLVAAAQGGRQFLANQQLLLTHNGEPTGGYNEGGTNYNCPACGKTFSLLTSLLQHQENRAACRANGQNVNLRLGNNAGHTRQTLRFYHGTTWGSAQQIRTNGFIPSESGCLGRGIYVAREDKARRFAQLKAESQGAAYGGLLELTVTFSNPKYVLSNDYHWQAEGYDACRAERTSASTNMEWCVRDASQVQVVGLEPVWL